MSLSSGYTQHPNYKITRLQTTLIQIPRYLKVFYVVFTSVNTFSELIDDKIVKCLAKKKKKIGVTFAGSIRVLTEIDK